MPDSQQTSQAVRFFIESLGYDPEQVCRVDIAPLRVEVTSYLLDERGKRYAEGDSVAKQVSVYPFAPIKDDTPCLV